MQRLVSADWLEKELGADDLRVLDCSVAFAFKDDGGFDIAPGREGWEAGHIPGSQHLDLLVDLSNPDVPVPLMLPGAEQFAAVLGRLGVGDGTRVVLYDGQASMWAARAWWMLRAYGFTNAAVLDGGITTWNLEGRPTASGPEPAPQAASFTARPQAGIFTDKTRVHSALDDPGTRLVDSLQPESFSGERCDYGRPGHIPGACNVPFAAVIDADTQRYLPPDQLREVLAPAMAGDPGQIITYCGGAIAASSVAFALGLVGVDNVAIYDGSMLEWAADPNLPLQTAS